MKVKEVSVGVKFSRNYNVVSLGEVITLGENDADEDVLIRTFEKLREMAQLLLLQGDGE